MHLHPTAHNIGIGCYLGVIIDKRDDGGVNSADNQWLAQLK